MKNKKKLLAFLILIVIIVIITIKNNFQNTNDFEIEMIRNNIKQVKNFKNIDVKVYTRY